MGIFSNGMFWAMVGAVAASIMCGYGSAKGVGMVGQAGSGVVAEKPENFGSLLLLQALPGTQGIYGLLIAFVVMLKVGAISGEWVDVSLMNGMIIFLASLPMAIVGYFSAIWQARTAVSAVNIVAKRPSEAAKGMTFSAMVETYAVLALLVSFLLIWNVAI